MAIQKVIITDYPDGSRVMSGIRNNKGIPVFKENDTVTATRVTTWYDGTPMDNSKADGKVYLRHKASGDFYLINLPNWGETFLEKDTMAQMRALTSTEVLLLKMGYYKGVKLNGYYTKGDTPAPIEYLLSTTSATDDGGSVIEVDGIKLEHVFTETLDLSYYGVKNNSLLDQTALIQTALNKGASIRARVTSMAGDFYINGRYNAGGRGLVIPSNSNIDFDKKARFIVLPQTNGSYTCVSIVSSENIKIGTLNLVGEKDQHISPNGSWIMWEANKSVSVNDYIYVNGWGFRVSVAGNLGSVKPVMTSANNVGDTLVSGTASLVITNSGVISSGQPNGTLGEWGMGLSILSSKNVYIKELNGESFWGDGLYLGKVGTEIPTNTNINIDYISLKNVRRQGVSVITVDGFYVDTIKVDTVIGAEPEAGIDFEPNNANEPTKNVRIRRVECYNTLDAAVLFVFAHLNSTSEPVDIKIGEIVDTNCRSSVRIGYNDNLENSKKRGLVVIDSIKSTKALGHAIDSPNFQYGVDFTFGNVYIEDCNQWNNVDPFGSGIRIYQDGRFPWKTEAITPIYKFNNIYSKSSDGKMNKIINVYEYGEGILSTPKLDVQILGEVVGVGANSENEKYRIKTKGVLNYKGLRNKPLSSSDGISLTTNTLSKIDNSNFTAETLFNINNMPIGWELTIDVINSNRIGIASSTSTNFKLHRFEAYESRSLNSALPGSSITIVHLGSNVWGVKNIVGRWYYGTEIIGLLPIVATVNDAGLAQIASQTEVNNGVNQNKYITPATLNGKLASTTIKGLVNQSTKVDDVASANTVTDDASTATDVTGVVTDLNDLISKYNNMVTLVNELKTKLNAKFGVDRTSGQQSTT